jgi:hypothetical protein
MLKIADLLINGDKKHYAMNDCLDSYYNDVFSKQIQEFNNLKQHLKL